MQPKSDSANGIERMDSHGTTNEETALTDEEIKAMPFGARLKYRLGNLLNSLRLFIYNKEQQTIMGTTSTSWFKISIYYLLFYICLGFFYCGMVAVFGAIISRESPRYTYRNSQLNQDGTCYIGMGFRPMSDINSNAITAYSDRQSQNASISSLRNYRYAFLTQYDLTYVDECSPTQTALSLRSGRSCQFTWTDIVPNEAHPCSETNYYGWSSGQPCVLIKLNQIYGWVPGTDDVTSKVANWTGQPILPVDQASGNIYITCNGVKAADVSALGSLQYYSLLHPLGNPSYGGIPFYFFPYLNSQDHVQPFVLVQFTSLPIDRVVNVECRAWASNIDQSSVGTLSRGMATFTLYRSNMLVLQHLNRAIRLSIELFFLMFSSVFFSSSVC